MRKSFLVLSLVLLPFLNVNAGEHESYNIPRTEVIPIKDAQSEKQYELYIRLPEKYAEDKDKKFPVIYYADAVWHIEALTSATEYIMDNAILVGISWQKNVADDLKEQYGAHVSRFSDYSFWKKSNPNHPKLKFGQAKQHLAFIRNKVFDYVESNYRTLPENRSYFGYSLSGLFGAYTLMAQPDSFKNYILGSPSVDLITRYKDDITFNKQKLNANVFISRGDQESDLQEPIETFVATLKKRSNSGVSIKHAVIEGDHSSAFPGTGVSSVTWLSKLQSTEGK